MRCLIAAVFVLAFHPLLAPGQDEKDTTKDPAAKIQAAFEKEAKSAFEQLLQTMQKRIGEVAKTGDLERVDALLTQFKQFATERVLPTDREFQSAYRAYVREIDSGLSKVRSIYEQAIAERTKQLEIDGAKELRDELAKFEKEMRAEFIEKRATNGEKANAALVKKIEEAKDIDLGNVKGLTFYAKYDNPSLPYVYETWKYRFPSGETTFHIIHASKGEVLLSQEIHTAPVVGFITISQDGYFRFNGNNAPRVTHGAFIVKRYRQEQPTP